MMWAWFQLRGCGQKFSRTIIYSRTLPSGNPGSAPGTVQLAVVVSTMEATSHTHQDQEVVINYSNYAGHGSACDVKFPRCNCTCASWCYKLCFCISHSHLLMACAVLTVLVSFTLLLSHNLSLTRKRVWWMSAESSVLIPLVSADMQSLDVTVLYGWRLR